MCSRLHECGGDDVNVQAGRSLSFSGNDHRNHTVDVATPVSGKLPPVVCPVSGWLPTAKIPCKFHMKQCCRRGGDCNFAHLNPTAATRPNNGRKTWTAKTPTQPLTKQCKASVGDGACATNMAMTATIGKATAKPTARSKTIKLPLGAAPGVWTSTVGSRGCRHSALSNEEWAAAYSKVEQRTAPKIIGPRFFTQRHVGNDDFAENHDDHDVDIITAGNLTASTLPTDASRAQCFD